HRSDAREARIAWRSIVALQVSIRAPQEKAMARHRSFVPQGVIPAVLLPFREDLSIDEPSYRAHLRDVARVDGLSALTINAHSSEVASCTLDEQRRVLEIAQDEVGSR